MLTIAVSAQEKAAYRIFDASGKTVSYEDMLKKASKADVVFFGEEHNNPISHWMELEITTDLLKAKNGKLILGAEMFERDNQVVLDEYLTGVVNQKSFEEESRVWDNYATDYKPLVELAKMEKIPFIATNIPRRYANLVFRKGLEALNTLSNQSKAWIAPLPINLDLNLPTYKAMIDMMGSHGGADKENIVKAQAVKDATMAYFISQNLKKGYLFLHYNGSYHSDAKEGIIWHLNQYARKQDIITISTVEQDELGSLLAENQKKADFIICVTTKMTKTY
jgi:uncharacterized iron-regulated protein